MNILITGAAQGIGYELAKDLCSSDNVLILTDLQEDKLNTVAEELKPKCANVISLSGDLTDSNYMSKLKSVLVEVGVDILVNNAAYAHKIKPFTELDKDTLDFSVKINLIAPFELLQIVVPLMNKKGKGLILNVASRANIYGYNGMAIYAATKAAITSLTGTIALENPSIKAVTIIPGRTNTAMQASIRGQEEANNAQSPDLVGDIIAKVVRGEIVANSGDSVIIDFGEYKVVSELDKTDLHRNMH